MQHVLLVSSMGTTQPDSYLDKLADGHVMWYKLNGRCHTAAHIRRICHMLAIAAPLLLKHACCCWCCMHLHSCFQEPKYSLLAPAAVPCAP